MDYDATALLASIRRRARCTNSAAPGFDNASLLAIANEVMLSEVVTELASRRASFFRKTINTTMTAGLATYDFNTRTIAGCVANFFRVDATDNSVHHLVEWDEEELLERDPTKQGCPQAFIIQGDQLRLYPVPSKADILRQVLLRRPNRVVLVSAAGVISSIAYPSDPTLITLNLVGTAAAAGITTSTPLDIIKGTSSFRSLADDTTPVQVVSSAVGLQLTAAEVALIRAGAASIGAGTAAGLAAGDYASLAGTAPLVQMPPEFFPVVAQRAACELLRPGRDRAIYQDAVEALQRLEERVFGVATDRVENQPGYLNGGDWPP